MNFSISEIKEIISTISTYENMDYSGYSISFLKRSFSKVFDLLNIKRIVQFYEQLKIKEIRDKVIGEMFVETTEMFRDPAFWRYVRDNILNKIPAESTLWFPNETTGEEVFSLSIILKEKGLLDNFNVLYNNPSNYLCSNINNGIVKIKNFEVNISNYKRLENLDLFETYFNRDSNTDTVTQEIRDRIKYKQVSCDKAIEDEKISMIFARNLSLSYNHNFSEHFFEMLYEKLMSGGFLALGIKEKLPASIADKMTIVSESEKIYKK